MCPNRGAQVTNPAGFTCAWLPEHPAASQSPWVPTAHPAQCGLTAHHDCAHTPLAHLHSGGRYFLHISDNSADGQSLSRLFLPSGQKSHVTIAPQKSNPSQCGGYPPKMWISPQNVDLGAGPSAGGWSEKPSTSSTDGQAMSTPRAAPAPLSSSPPTHSTSFNCGNRCGNKQVRQRPG